MRLVIQRVKEANVTIDYKIKSSISIGLLVLLGITNEDTEVDIKWLVQKLINLRIFNDEAGKMNLSLKDINGELLIISQFTLYASTKKGNRPSYLEAAKPEIAIPLYELFISTLKASYNSEIKTGTFGADMKVSLINDGPVTIIIDSKNKT